jgi:hypothetical protein
VDGPRHGARREPGHDLGCSAGPKAPGITTPEQPQGPDQLRHPTANATIVISLLSVIGVPIGLLAIGAGVRWWQRPDSEILRTVAEASRRAAAALDDAETAERIKAELNAYIALRARRLELDRRRQELLSSAEVISQSIRELNKAEAQLGIDLTRLAPETVATLGSLVNPESPVKRLGPFLKLVGLLVPIGGPVLASGGVTDSVIDSLDDYLTKRRFRRLATIAPEALADEAAKKKPEPPD